MKKTHNQSKEKKKTIEIGPKVTNVKREDR